MSKWFAETYSQLVAVTLLRQFLRNHNAKPFLLRFINTNYSGRAITLQQIKKTES